MHDLLTLAINGGSCRQHANGSIVRPMIGQTFVVIFSGGVVVILSDGQQLSVRGRAA